MKACAINNLFSEIIDSARCMMIWSRLAINWRQNVLHECRRIALTQTIQQKYAVSASLHCFRYISNGESIPASIPSGAAELSKSIQNDKQRKSSLSDVILKPGNTAPYLAKVSIHLHEGHLKKAIAVVETDMVQNDHIRPDKQLFDLLMNECGRQGFAKKCFQLYKLMNQCGEAPTTDTYTAMLNACLNTPFRNDALSFLQRAREVMRNRDHRPTHEQYTLMVEIFAKFGEFEKALDFVHKSKKLGINLGLNAYKMLLHTASEDEETGFRNALIVWHRMYRNDIVPDVFAFNLLLKCVSDCSIGDVEEARRTIEHIIMKSRDLNEGTESKTAEVLDHRPNLLSKQPQLGKLLPLKEVIDAPDRLLLLGGIGSVIQEMQNCNAKPTDGTFLQLLSVIPATTAAEIKFLTYLRRAEIEPNMIFFNAMLKKRCLNLSFDEAMVSFYSIQTKNGLKYSLIHLFSISRTLFRESISKN